ncbi:MAG: glutamyl-tRNA reductase [Sandaracinaceae bacterium]|nr:glutamyl-tRNA reductase [Sandaracinaceae bacterium]MDW8245428.1 glutamyl-tRNA reductase [Sandaracinaceae bacterium]
MKEFFVLGLSHHTAPLEIRERLALPPLALPEALAGLRQEANLKEALLLSTCNRVELYAVAQDDGGKNHARRWMEERARPAEIFQALYLREGKEAIRHAFRVASSLDSMVVGEPQILGQIKEAYRAAESNGAIGPVLRRVFTQAFAVARRVRRETAIASGSVSVSSVACDLAGQIFESMQGKRVLLIGAGKMAEAAARKLAQGGAKLFVLNRSLARAAELAARYGGEPRGFSELESELKLADIAISSTASTRFVVEYEAMREIVRERRYRPLFLIDIAVPRDVDPRVGALEGVFLYDIDDLRRVAEDNLLLRRKEAEAAEKIIEQEVASFERASRESSLKPIFGAIDAHVRKIIRQELEEVFGHKKSIEAKDIDRAIERAASKLLHPIFVELRRAAENGNIGWVTMVPRLFGISTKEIEKESTQKDPEPPPPLQKA